MSLSKRVTWIRVKAIDLMRVQQMNLSYSQMEHIIEEMFVQIYYPSPLKLLNINENANNFFLFSQMCLFVRNINNDNL